MLRSNFRVSIVGKPSGTMPAANWESDSAYYRTGCIDDPAVGYPGAYLVTRRRGSLRDQCHSPSVMHTASFSGMAASVSGSPMVISRRRFTGHGFLHAPIVPIIPAGFYINTNSRTNPSTVQLTAATLRILPEANNRIYGDGN